MHEEAKAVKYKCFVNCIMKCELSFLVPETNHIYLGALAVLHLLIPRKSRTRVPNGTTQRGRYIYISFIRSHVTYNSGTIWKRWQTNKKSAGKKQIKWKKSKNQYKNLEGISRHCHVHKNISRYLRYGSSHGGAATPQPSLTVFDSKTGQRGSRTSKTPPTSHIKKCIYDQEIPQCLF